MDKIFATPEDYHNKRKFCSVYVDVSPSGLKLTTYQNVFISNFFGDNDLRFSSMGSIDNVPLGKLRPQSRSAECFTGYITDYAENYEVAIQTGRNEAIKLRDEFAAKMAANIVKFLSLKVETNKP